MYVPRSIKKRFAELGALEFYGCAEADEVDGIESVVDPWVEGLWPALRKAMAMATGVAAPAADGVSQIADGVASVDMAEAPPLPDCRVHLMWEEDAAQQQAVVEAETAATAGPSAQELAYRDAGGQYSPENPFWARVRGARYLTAEVAEKRVVHLELDISGSGLSYSPGDSVGVLVPNNAVLVDALLSRLKVDPAAVFSVQPRQGSAGAAHGGTDKLLPHLRWPCTVRHAFLHGVDLNSPPRKSLLRLLAEHCSEAGDRKALLVLCGREGKGAYAKLVEGQPNLLQLLHRYPSCCPPLDALLDLLPALAPRMYSITTAPQAYPDQVHVAFTVVDVQTEWGRKKGVATTFLESAVKPLLQQQGEQTGTMLAVFHRGGGAFHPPQDVSKPWIMIGPGTGVAPFRGFLQSRRAVIKAGTAPSAPAWLFFGCRRSDEDYLYKEELEEFVSDGTLTKLEVAFSREQERKVYVQHMMRKHGKALFDMIEDDGYVFVCGDGAAMAKDVHSCLQDIVVEHGGVDAKEAGEQLMHMTQQGRYVRDVWS